MSKPFLTYYDGDERTELSYATFDNWVAKTANWLRDEHGALPGRTVGIDKPHHWLGAVTAFAAWRCGATPAPGAGDVTVTVAEVADEVLVQPDAFTGGHDLPDGPADSRRLLVTGDVIGAALAAYRGGGSIVFGHIADPAHVRAVERAH